jgi:hypothetical protein
VLQTPTSWGGSSGYVTNIDDITNAQKYGKYALSALNFDDTATAIKNFETALKILTMGSKAALGK